MQLGLVLWTFRNYFVVSGHCSGVRRVSVYSRHSRGGGIPQVWNSPSKKILSVTFWQIVWLPHCFGPSEILNSHHPSNVWVARIFTDRRVGTGAKLIKNSLVGTKMVDESILAPPSGWRPMPLVPLCTPLSGCWMKKYFFCSGFFYLWHFWNNVISNQCQVLQFLVICLLVW